MASKKLMKTEQIKSGFDAMGYDVPVHRLNKAAETVKEMLPHLKSEDVYTIVAKAAKFVRQDKPFEIVGAIRGLDKDLDKIDLTGRYRLLAVLLS